MSTKPMTIVLPTRVHKAFRRLAKANGQSASSRGALLVERDLAQATAAKLAGREEQQD